MARGVVLADLVEGERSSTSVLSAAIAVGRSVIRTMSLAAHRRIHQPQQRVGLVINFADGSSAQVYRETVIDGDPVAAPAFLAVSFRLRLVKSRRAHALFRAESELNTLLFAGFPGLVSKLWLRHDGDGMYRGLYQWDGAERALDYVNALWWVLALVSVRGSVRFAIVPGVTRDQMLAGPEVSETRRGSSCWWLPADSPTQGSE